MYLTKIELEAVRSLNTRTEEHLRYAAILQKAISEHTARGAHLEKDRKEIITAIESAHQLAVGSIGSSHQVSFSESGQAAEITSIQENTLIAAPLNGSKKRARAQV